MYMLPVRATSLVFFFDHVHKVVGMTAITVIESRGQWFAFGGPVVVEKTWRYANGGSFYANT